MTTGNETVNCSCSEAPKLIFACSGAADVGQVADLAARKLTAEGVGKMFCLAGIGGRVSGILETTRAAEAILAIDGCPLDCARNSLKHAGFTNIHSIRLSDMQMEKGRTPPSRENVDKVVQQGRDCLGRLVQSP